MRLCAILVVATVTVALPRTSPSAQVPRDAARRPEATGAAVIRGRVIAGDTGNPIRRGRVSLQVVSPPMPSGPSAPSSATVLSSRDGAPATPRQTVTDGDGAFEFRNVLPGAYRIFASPGQYSGQYVSISYGAKPSNTPLGSDLGVPIHIADGQIFDKVIIALPRGAVVTGRVIDNAGEPLARVSVHAIAVPAGSPRGLRVGQGAQTDDLGQYRLYGLQSGEFVIVADARENTFSARNATPEPEGDPVGFTTTYFPGVIDESAAQRVRVRAGMETSGVDIRLSVGRLFRVSGTVTDSQGRGVSGGNGQLVRRGTSLIGIQNFFFRTDAQGAFRMRDIPAGEYRLNVQHSVENSAAAQPDPELASVALTVGGADVENVAVVLRPGTTITGQVVFEQEAPASAISQLRIVATPADAEDEMGSLAPQRQSSVARDTLTFTLKGLMGDSLIRAYAPNQYMRSVTAGGEDIMDTPREFKATDRIVVTLTSLASTVEGTATDASGAIPTGAGVIMFSDNKAHWRNNATRTKRTGIDPNGSFRVSGLMPGRYYIAAVPRERLTFPVTAIDVAYFEQLTKDASIVVVGENSQHRLDLTLIQPGGR